MSAALVLGLAGCGGDGGDGEPAAREARPTAVPAPAVLQGGSTTLVLDATSMRVLEAVGVDVRATGAAARRDGRLRFPIRGGELALTPPRGAIEHAGGLRFSARGRQVDARELIVDPGNHVMTGIVRGRRIPLLRLDMQFPRALPPDGREVVIGGRAAVFGGSIVGLLGRELGVEKLAEGLPLGDVRIAAET
jgi:hypothetical protein